MGEAMRHGNEAIRHGLDHLAETVADVKPKLRGWLHLGIAPLTLAAGIVLIALSPDAVTRVGSAMFTGSAVILFTVSAIYHRGTWSPKVWAFLRRFDHSNIFLLIAGSYTPFALVLLEGTQRTVLLSVVWTGAILGVLFRVFWVGAPRWLYVPDLHRAGLGRRLLHPGLRARRLRGRRRHRHRRPGADHRRRRPLHARWRRLRVQAARTPRRAGSASTRCSTPSRSWPSPATTSASRSRRTPCADPGAPRQLIVRGIGHRALADQVAADVRRRRARRPGSGRAGAVRRPGRRRRPAPPLPGSRRARRAQGVALRPRRADDRHLDRSVEHRLGGGERPAREAWRLLGERVHGAQRLLRRLSVAAGARQRGVGGQCVDSRRQPGRAGVVGRVARTGDQGLGVVGRVVEPAVVGAEVLECGLQQRLCAGQPDRVTSGLQEGEVRQTPRRPWSSSTPACRPATPSRDTRSSRPSASTCRRATSSPAATAAATYSSRPSRRPASHRPLMASPFHAATTLSSRAGRTRVSRAVEQSGTDVGVPLRVVGVGQQLEGGGAVLEGAGAGHLEQLARPRRRPRSRARPPARPASTRRTCPRRPRCRHPARMRTRPRRSAARAA